MWCLVRLKNKTGNLKHFFDFFILANQGRSQDFWQGSAIWSEVTDTATCFANEATGSAADRATAVVRTAPVNGIVTKNQIAIQGVRMNSRLILRLR